MISKEEYYKLVADEAAAVLEVYSELGSIKALSKYLDLPYNKIRTRLKELNILRQKGRIKGKYDEEVALKDKQIYEEYLNSDSTLAVIAQKYGVKRQRIEQRIVRYEKRNGLEKKRNDHKITKTCCNPECRKEFKGRKSKYCSPTCGYTMLLLSQQTALPILEMIQEYQSGDGYFIIGKRYSCSPTTVERHLKRLGIKSRPRPPQLRLPNHAKAS